MGNPSLTREELYRLVWGSRWLNLRVNATPIIAAGIIYFACL